MITSRWLMRLGIMLFSVGLITGLFTKPLSNPRMAVTGHLIGIIGGMFLMIMSLTWSRLQLSPRSKLVFFWTAVYGTYASWTVRVLAAAWDAGGSMMPLASNGHMGSNIQEGAIKALILTLIIALSITCGLFLWGLRGSDDAIQGGDS